MTATQDHPHQAPATGPDPDDGDGGNAAVGRLIDVASIVAACVLGVIIFDVFSGGKVTRWLSGRKGGGCAGCGGEAADGDS